MFVLTTTAKAVRESNDPYIGLLLMIATIIILTVSAVLIYKMFKKGR